MATHHASSGEIVDLKSWASDLKAEQSKVITKTEGLELARLVIGAGVNMHHSGFCRVSGASVFQCLEGHVILKTPDKQIPIKQGQLVHLEAGAEHAIVGVVQSVVLLTIVL